jgi:hypothetical protein
MHALSSQPKKETLSLYDRIEMAEITFCLFYDAIVEKISHTWRNWLRFYPDKEFLPLLRFSNTGTYV